MTKLFLKNNWAETFIYGDETPGNFVGRKDEIENLKFALLNNDSGAILVSAIRGVGKTSFVHKALSEIKNKKINICPIFVNSGHVMSLMNDTKTAKEGLLTSLIRAAYYAQKDSEIEEIYFKAIGKFKEHKSIEELNEESSEKNTDISTKSNGKNLIIYAGLILTMLGINLEGIWAKILGCIGLLSITTTFSWKKKWTNSIKTAIGKETIVENSIDYIEFLFETWLKKQKKKRLIFIIDELDKVEEKHALSLIKEYKNLFSRSFTHFIFIAGPEAYQLIKQKRELSANEGGIFPTLFTHSYYLPLPNAGELQEYLSHIIEGNQKKDEITELKNYLLFKAKNDFFALKNTINDLVLLENEKAFLEIEHIKNIDLYFYRITKIYNYAALFCEKKFKRGKGFWEENSKIQSDIFEFLNNKIKGSFSIYLDKYPKYIQDLLKYLQRLKTITITSTDNEEDDGNTEEKLIEFAWTGNYKNIESADQIFDEELDFIDKFKELIVLANDLNFIVNGKRYISVHKGYDGEKITGISLASIHQNYKYLYNKVNDPKSRMGVLLEDVINATEDIKSNIDNIYQDILSITAKKIKLKLQNKTNLYTNKTFAEKPEAFKACFSFKEVFSNYEHSIFGTTDGEKEVLIIKDFNDFEKIQKDLSILNSFKHKLLVINIITNETPDLEIHPTIQKNKIGYLIKKGIVVKNFYNYRFTGKITQITTFAQRVNQFFQYS